MLQSCVCVASVWGPLFCDAEEDNLSKDTDSILMELEGIAEETLLAC